MERRCGHVAWARAVEPTGAAARPEPAPMRSVAVRQALARQPRECREGERRALGRRQLRGPALVESNRAARPAARRRRI